MASFSRPLPTGIYTPLPTFFSENEDLDLESFAAHVQYTTKAGTIPVVAGSAGEAPHLSSSERVRLIQAARSVLASCHPSLDHVPVIAGVGAASTRETIRLAQEAAEAGADYVMVIPPGYYAGPLTANGGEALRRFFVDVAKASPCPVIVYNFPGVSSGIDLSSDLIVDVVKQTDNVVGVKLTCASVGKITRINAEVSSDAFQSKYPRKDGQVFRIIDGYIDVLLPSVASGAAGAISGLPNLVPRICVKLWELSSRSIPGSPEYSEAQRLQGLLALVDGFLQTIGFAGIKMLLHQQFGYSELPRRPLLPASRAEGAEWMTNKYLAAAMKEDEALG